jgi:hypothetical protein
MSRPLPPRKPFLAGVWFPAGLVVLLLLGLPAVLLLILALFGLENKVNGWLQNNLGLSYHLPIPWWAGLLLLLFPLLLILLYFLKLKRRPLQVPSTFLWRKSIDDLHVNSLFQWLRDNVLLLIQLLTILVLIYAILAMQVHGESKSGKHYVLMIDSSASMAVADEDGATRLEAAKQAALNEIAAHAAGDSGMIIEFNSRAAILQPYTTDKALLRAAVNRIEQTRRTTNIEEALQLAESLANPYRSTENEAMRPPNEEPGKERTYVPAEGLQAEVHLLSDGRFADVSSFAAGNLNLTYHRIGLPGSVDNVGFVTFNAIRDDRDRSTLRLLARVQNFSPDPVDLRVELEWRIQGEEDFRLLELPAPDKPALKIPALREEKSSAEGEPSRFIPGEKAVSFELNNVEDQANVQFHARLKGREDSFPLDNEAWLVVGIVRKARVLIVTPGNDILHNFFDLDATQQVAKVTYLTPEGLKDAEKYVRPVRSGAFDLVLFDRCAPANEEEMPLGNTFFIGDVPPPWKRSEMKPLTEVAIRNPTSDHSLMRHLTGLDEIAFTGAFHFPLDDKRLPTRVPRLLEVDRERAVLFVRPRQSFQDLILTFPLVKEGQWMTTWNLKLSFPVFLRNVLYELGNVQDASAEENVQPGQIKTIRPDVAVETIRVQAPGSSGSEVVKRTRELDFPYKNTDQVGIYRAFWDGGGRSFAVNLLDSNESQTRPRESIKLGAQQLVSDQVQQQTYPIWKWGALGALVLLVLEWAIYHRRLFF